MQGSTIILLGVIGIITAVNYYIKNRDVVYVKSKADGREYRMADAPDKQQMADMLGTINLKAIKLVEHFKVNNPDKNQDIDRLCKNYNPDVLGENLDYKSYQAYTLNKGSEVQLCMRNKDGTLINDSNTMIFVLIHEIAHIMTYENGHPPKFWENMGYLLKKASEIGIYNPIDYSKTPVDYCGVKIDQTPYRF